MSTFQCPSGTEGIAGSTLVLQCEMHVHTSSIAMGGIVFVFLKVATHTNEDLQK